jgi:hypothetical protein
MEDDMATDDAPPPAAQLGWLEQQFVDQNIIVLCIFGFCCSGLAAIIAAIVYFTGTNEVAKKNALIVMIIGGIMFLVHGGGCCGGNIIGFGGRRTEVLPKVQHIAVASVAANPWSLSPKA